jgi:hypothetical protein
MIMISFALPGGLVGEDLPGLVLYEELHLVDGEGPGVHLAHHHLHLVAVQDPRLHPRQVHSAVHLGITTRNN